MCIRDSNNIGEAKTILENVCEVNEDIMKEPGPVIGVANHGDNAVMLDLKVWCRTEKYWDIKYFLEENVKIAFEDVYKRQVLISVFI